MDAGINPTQADPRSTREIARDQLTGIIERERDLIRWANPGRNDDMPDQWLGLALSGGGIRSASFALGILQALNGWDLFRRIDYLSTVSGGGYIGASLTYFLQSRNMAWRGEFPFGERRHAGARSVAIAQPNATPQPLAWRIGEQVWKRSAAAFKSRSGDSESEIPTSDEEEASPPNPTAIVSYLRLHAHYLTPSPRLGWPAFIGSAIRAAFTALAVYFPLLVLVMAILASSEFLLVRWPWLMSEAHALHLAPYLLIRDCQETAAPALDVCGPSVSVVLFNWPVVALLLVTALSIANALLYVKRTDSTVRHPERFKRLYPRVMIDNAHFNGTLFRLFVFLALLSALPWLVHYMQIGLRTVLAASISTLAGYLGTLWDFRSRLKGATDGDSVFVQARPIVFAVLAAYGLLVLALSAAEYVVALHGPQTDWMNGLYLFGGLAVWILLLNAFSNLNLISQHRMYRDRLMEAFCPSDRALARMSWRPSVSANNLPLSLCAPGAGGPYHLINTALVAPQAKSALYRSRSGDNFVLSPVACGSDATGWTSTWTFMNNSLTLPTAMAISGAALNAHSGAGESAPTRNAVLSFLLTLFGAQLGFWAPHPMADEKGQTRQPKFLVPGLYGLTGWRLDADRSRSFVQLADGGHFENLGLYELVRRRLDLIICSDAGQDKDYVFEDLGIAVERLRVDFGTDIDFRYPDHGPAHLLPGSMADGGKWAELYQLAKRGFAISEICYPETEDPLTGAALPEKSGYLLYFKATLIEGLPSDLYAYKKLNKDFPDQTTVDQDFDEFQFEAYRELGYRLANQCFVELFGAGDKTAITMDMLWKQLATLCAPRDAEPPFDPSI